MRTMKIGFKNGYIIIGLALVCVIASCSGTEEIAFEPAPFTADPELLAEQITIPELDLQVRPPQGWVAVDSVTLDSYRRMQAGTAINQEFYPIYSEKLFIDSVTGAMAYIARVEETEGRLEQVNERYKDFLLSRIDESSLQSAYYTINGLNICYYLHHTAQIVNHKLLSETPDGNRFLMEYVVPAFANPDLEPAMKSSIATLQPSGE